MSEQRSSAELVGAIRGQHAAVDSDRFIGLVPNLTEEEAIALVDEWAAKRWSPEPECPEHPEYFEVGCKGCLDACFGQLCETENQVLALRTLAQGFATLLAAGHRKLATYRNVYDGDKELRRLLDEWEAALLQAKERGLA